MSTAAAAAAQREELEGLSPGFICCEGKLLRGEVELLIHMRRAATNKDESFSL